MLLPASSSRCPVPPRASGASCPPAHACACLSFLLRSASRTRCSTACKHTRRHCCQCSCLAISLLLAVAVAGVLTLPVLVLLAVRGSWWVACVRLCGCLRWPAMIRGGRLPCLASASSCLCSILACTSLPDWAPLPRLRQSAPRRRRCLPCCHTLVWLCLPALAVQARARWSTLAVRPRRVLCDRLRCRMARRARRRRRGRSRPLCVRPAARRRHCWR